MAPPRIRLAVPLFALGLAGCGAAGGPETEALVMRVDTVGDTIVVRTERGSVWGGGVSLAPVVRIGSLDGDEEYTFGRVSGVALAPDGSVIVLDQQARAVRVYDGEGRHLRSFGRAGGGPGEMGQPTGLSLLPDGRVLVSDPRNARVNVFSPDGDPVDSWPMNGGFVTNDQVRATAAGRAYVWGLLTRDFGDFRQAGWIEVGPVGVPNDTIRGPHPDFEPAILQAVFEQGGGRSIAVNALPFAAQNPWTLSPLGYAVGGVSTRYAVEAFRPDGRVVRMERAVEPVPVTAGERAYREHQVTTSLRRTDPNWRWSGPGIPATKAPFTQVLADDDGRVWVRVAAPGEVVPREERPEPRPGQPRYEGPEPWREPILYDVFDADGRFLGTLLMPPRFTWSGARGDRVWGVIRDELDVEYVTVFQIEGIARS
jgi:hypothetical protein